MKKQLIAFILSGCLTTLSWASACDNNDLRITNLSLVKLWVKDIKLQGNSKLGHLSEGQLIKGTDRLKATARAASGFSLHRHTATGDIILRADAKSQHTVTLHYHFYPSNNVCVAEGAVHFSGGPSGQVVVHPQDSTHHRARVEFILLPRS